MTEKELINRLQEQDEKAFEYLVDHYQEMIGNTCFGFVQNQVEAEELTQDVFVEVHLSINKFKAQSKLSTWIYRIAVNKSINYLNHKKRKRRINSVSMFFGFGEGKEKDFADPRSVNPEKQIEDQEVKEALENAINKLPENQRIAFVLRKYDDLSYSEIAEIMNATVSSVESLIHRGSRNLKKYLEHYYHKNFRI